MNWLPAILLAAVIVLLCRYAVKDFRQQDYAGVAFALILVTVFVGVLCFFYPWLLAIIEKLVIVLVLPPLLVFGALLVGCHHR